MYHYVRELPYTRYPSIKGLLASEFKEQLSYMKKYYKFVTIDDCINAINSDAQDDFPENAILLTFDDAYIDHFTTVFPVLEEMGIQGCFFPSAKAILKNTVLDVNKIHFLLASVQDIDKLVNDIYMYMDQHREMFCLKSNDHYFQMLAKKDRFDSKEVIFVKRLLQVELEEKLRNLIVDGLFKKYVSGDESAFSRELYMNIDQLKCMSRNGMYIGSHGYDHYWLNSLPIEEQEKEIDLSLNFLSDIGSSTDNWAMCYPYGAYNDSLISLLKRKKCKLALTTKVDIATLNKSNAYTLERLDTNDLPKISSFDANSWTRKIIN